MKTSPSIILIIIIIVVNSSISSSQSIYTKDGVSLGERDVFMKSCISNADEKVIDLNGVTMDVESYCSCMCDNLIPTLTSAEINEAFENDAFLELIFAEQNLDIIINCASKTVEFEDEYKIEETDNPEWMKKMGISTCVKEIMDDPDNYDVWSSQMAYDYCNCAIEKLYSEGYTYKDIKEMEDEDSKVFNEIVVQCINEILQDISTEISENSYNPDEIIGNSSISRVQILDYFGQGYKLKISINGITKYFLLDTGASELIINHDIERELLLTGALKREDYISKEIFEMANNEIVEGQIVRLDNISIGDYIINNVNVAIIEDGSLMCGIGFLKKFRKWELDKENMVLKLFR